MVEVSTWSSPVTATTFSGLLSRTTLLRAYANDGPRTFLGILSHHTGVDMQEEFNREGSIAFTYLRDAPGADVIDADDALIVPVENGVERDDWYLLEEDTDDESDTGGGGISVAGRGALALLDRAVVDATGDQRTEDGSARAVIDTSPGAVLDAFLTEAQERGAIPEVTWSFTASVDSAGTPWPKRLTYDQQIGSSLLAVVTAWADNGWADVRMSGREVRLYVPDTYLGVDRPDKVLRRGRDVSSGPRRRSRRDIHTAMLGQGDNATMVYVTDPNNSQTRWGIREGYDGRGGVSDSTALTALVQTALTTTAKVAEGLTLEYVSGTGGPWPGEDYRVGDYIRYDRRRVSSTEFEPLRVRTVARRVDVTGGESVSVELNDVFTEQSIKVARKVEAILNGSTTATSDPIPADPPPAADTTVPDAVTGVGVSSLGYHDPTGAPKSSATVTWPGTQYNTDGSVADDINHFEVQSQRQVDTGPLQYAWAGHQSTVEPSMVYMDLPPGGQFSVRVRAVDNAGHVGAWSNTVTVVLESDNEPPPKPSAPVVQPQFRGVRALWSGLTEDGAGQPDDFGRYDVHVDTNSGFTPTFDNRVDTVYTQGGVSSIQDLTFGVTYYVKIVAYDLLGNASVPSEPGSATTERLSDPDLPDNLIDGARHIKEGTVNVRDLTVGAFGDNALPNGSMEDVVEGVALPAGWVAGAVTGSGGGLGVETNNPVNGTSSLREDVDVGAATTVWSAIIPVTPGAVYYVAARFRTSRLLNSNAVGLAVAFGQTPEDVGYNVPGWGSETLIGRTTAGTTPVLVEGSVEVPYDDGSTNGADMKWARVVLLADPDSTGYTVFADDVEVRKIVGTAAIADASINSAKIKQLAVDDAKIANVSVGKLTAGTLVADVTLSARIKTSNSGARVELSSSGLRQFNGSNTLLTHIPTDGSPAVVTGTFQTGFNANRVQLTSQAGHAYVNLFTGANAETTPGVLETFVDGDTEGGTSSPNGLRLHAPKTNNFRSSYMELRACESDSVGANIFFQYHNGQVFWDGEVGYGAHVYRTGATNWLNIRPNDEAGVGRSAFVDAPSGSFRVTADNRITLHTDKGDTDIYGYQGVQVRGGTGSVTVLQNLVHQNGQLLLESSVSGKYRIRGIEDGAGRALRSDDVYDRTYTSAANVVITGAGTLGRETSSAKYKAAIDRSYSAEPGLLDKVKALIPVSYYDKGNAERYADLVDPTAPPKPYQIDADFPKRLVGLIAEDVDATGLSDLVEYDAEGKPEGVAYARLAVLLIPWLRELDARLTALETP